MDKIIFTTILITFPLGQLIKFGMFNLFDVLIFVLAVWTFLQKPKYPKWFTYFLSFILFGLFSWIFNYFVFNNILAFRGLLYLVRLLAYSYVAIYIFNYVKDKKSVVRSLLAVSIASAALGWLQYLFLPDTRFLKNFGWDDHLYRMVGTFFDPAFLALILLLGIVIALFYKKTKIFTTKSQALLIFLLISLAFTYSRATYLVLSLFLFYQKKYLAIIVFAITVLLLPKMLSEGTDFGRVVSTQNKLENYKETFQIIKKSPVLGIGFNNICLAKENIDTNSHSCFGSDNSILFILATTGVIGLILLAYSVQRIAYSLMHSTYYILLSTSFFVVLMHSMFTNSLFYPHIMFWLFSLVGLETKIDRKRS